jgi:hypothetical protein
MENVSSTDELFKLEWYYIDSTKKEPAGPLSIRDLDVLMRTNFIDTNTYVWKDGMQDWKKIFQIQELKDIVNTTHTEIQESLIRSKIQASFNTATNHKSENNSVENYYFGADGLWHVYNPITKVWTTQETKPVVRKKSFENETAQLNIEDTNDRPSDLTKNSIVNISEEIVDVNLTSKEIKNTDSLDLDNGNNNEEKEIEIEKIEKEISSTDKVDVKNKFTKKKRKFEDKIINKTSRKKKKKN